MIITFMDNPVNWVPQKVFWKVQIRKIYSQVNRKVHYPNTVKLYIPFLNFESLLNGQRNLENKKSM